MITQINMWHDCHVKLIGDICWSKYFALQSSTWNHRPWGYYTACGWQSVWEFPPPWLVAGRRGWYMSGFTILWGRSSMLPSLWMYRCWLPFLAWSTLPILLQQVRNSATRGRSLYKMNDIKYKNGINPTTNSIWRGKGFALVAYIIKKIVKPNKTKAKPSITLKKFFL